MLPRARVARRIDGSEGSVIHSGAPSHLRHERTLVHCRRGSKLPLDEEKPGPRFTSRTRGGLTNLREEVLICMTSESQDMDGRTSKRRLGGDIVAQDSSPGKHAGRREGLRLQHSPPEGWRSEKGSVSRISSADAPLALGSDVGNKRRRRAPVVYQESGGGHVEKESMASQSSIGQTEDNERRSERLKERRKLEKKKNLEECQEIHWEVQFASARRKKASGRRLQQKGKRSKAQVQAKKQVKGSWSLDQGKGMNSTSTEEGHDEQGAGLTWTSRLRERGKKRVLEFCAEVQVEAFASDARLVKQKIERADERNPEQTTEELDNLFVRSWSRKHPRNFRTRARFQSLPKEEQLGLKAAGSDLPTSLEGKQLGVPTADATASRDKESNLYLENACHVSSGEHINLSVQKSASNSFYPKCRAGSVEDSSVMEGRAEHMAQPAVSKVATEDSHLEALEVESEEQIEIVLDLGIKPSRERFSKDDIKPITSKAASSSANTVSSLLQTPASAPCELAEVPSASDAGFDTVLGDLPLTSTHEVLETREYQTCNETAIVGVLEVALSSSCKEVTNKKLFDLQDHLNYSGIVEEITVESGEHRVGIEFPKVVEVVKVVDTEVCKPNHEEVVEVVKVVDTEICKPNHEEVVKVPELTACSEHANGTVVESCGGKGCTMSVSGTAVEVGKHGGAIKGTGGILLGVEEDRVSMGVLREKVVEFQDHAVKEQVLCHDVEEVVDLRKGVLGQMITSQRVHGKEHVVHIGIRKEKVPEGQEQKNPDKASIVKAFEDEDHTVCYKIAEQEAVEATQQRFRGICEEKVAAAEKDYSVCDEMMKIKISNGREHVICTDAVEYVEPKVFEGLDHSESGDYSGNSDEGISGGLVKEVPRGAEDSIGNSVDDFDVLAKYCRGKSRKQGSRRSVEKTDVGTFHDENGEEAEIAGEDLRPSSLKASTNSGRSEPGEGNGSEDQEETVGTRLQSLLDVVRIEVNATPELLDSSDCREIGLPLAASHIVRRTEEPFTQNAFTKERAAKYSNDFKRGFVSLGLKCGLCGGSSDGKWACELRSARKTKARDGSSNGSPKMSKLDVKEWGKLQVKKGWLGRLLGPLSERVGVAGAWVHEECAVWSPEVYFAGVGRLKNVKAAIRRGRLLKCSHCGQPGATIGCRVDRCPQNYHLPCAHFDGCSFDHKKYLVACAEHLHLFPSRCRRFLECGNDVQKGGSGDMKDSSKLHRGNFRRMMIERRAAASTARLRDLEEEEKCMEKSGEDEEFVRRERKRLQRDLARIVPKKLGGRNTEGEEITIPEGWNSVAGLQDVVECLKEMVILPLLYPDAFVRLGIVPPRGVLLHGHSGTGKTLVVRALAGACARGAQRISYFARKGADCLGKYVGDAERQLRLLFQVAEQHQPSIIFFDEIDGLAPSRLRDGQDQTHSSVVSTLLALMDGLSSRGSVIVIGATNRPDALDPALRRPGRFDREIYFPLPSVPDRAAILALHTRLWVPRPSAEVLSAVARSTRGFAGADLRALCVEVALKALKRVAPIHRLMESAERGQIGDKLPRLPKIKVKAFDWASALREAPPPCSMRMTSAALSYIPGSPLPWYLAPSLLPALVEVLLQLHWDGRCSMPPAVFKAVSLIAFELQLVARRGELSMPRSQYKWMVLLQSSGHKLVESVEANLTAAGLVGKVEGLSGHVEPASGEALPSKPSTFNIDSASATSKSDVHGDWRTGQFRVLISGKGKRGQRLVAASIIAGFEGFCEARTLNLPTMLHEGGGDVIQGLNRILGPGIGSTPCMLFMPQIESWSVFREDVGDESPGGSKTSCSNDVQNFDDEAVSEVTLRSEVVDRGSSLATVSSTWSVFLQHIKCISPKNSIMFLATSHLPLDELPSKVVEFFVSDTTKCTEKHMISTNQPVPCALVQLPPLREYMAVVERAAQDISRSLAGRLVRFLNNNKESSDGSYASAVSRLADPGFPLDETPQVRSWDGSFDDASECLPDAECSQPMEQLSSSIVPDMPEHSRLSSCLPELTFKPEICGRGSLEDIPASLFRPRTLPESTDQRTLQFAIAQSSHQILNQAHFSDLRRISARIKAGPSISTSVIDQRILGIANHNISLAGDNKPFEDRFDKKDDRSTHGSQVYGLVAVGFKGKSGLYSSGTEFACEIATVLKLLRERVKSKVESGRDYSVYVPLLSKISGLEDIVRSWSYQTRRLEAASEVLGGALSSALVSSGKEDASQPGFEAHEAPSSIPLESSDRKASPYKVHETVGESSPNKGQLGDQNPIDRQNPDSETVVGGVSVLDTAEGCDTAPMSSDKLVAERTVANESTQRDSLENRSNLDAEVHFQTSVENNVKSQYNRNVAGPVVGSSEDAASQLQFQKNERKQRHVYLKSQSLHPLNRSIRKMILVAWKNDSAESVELLYEIIASCAASIRVVSDVRIRNVQWTSGCHGEVPCAVGTEQTTKTVDGLRREICLCPLTEAVRKLIRQPSEEAVDLLRRDTT